MQFTKKINSFLHSRFTQGRFYVNAPLERLMLDELRNSCRPGQVGGFLPGVKQIANVAALPGIVGHRWDCWPASCPLALSYVV